LCVRVLLRCPADHLRQSGTLATWRTRHFRTTRVDLLTTFLFDLYVSPIDGGVESRRARGGSPTIFFVRSTPHAAPRAAVAAWNRHGRSECHQPSALAAMAKTAPPTVTLFAESYSCPSLSVALAGIHWAHAPIPAVTQPVTVHGAERRRQSLYEWPWPGPKRVSWRWRKE
jgi:hypothetical protein